MQIPKAAALYLLLAAAAAPAESRGEGFRSFEEFLREYERAAPESRPGLARSFTGWQQARGGFPALQPDGSVIFVYVGAGDEQSARLVGDFRTRSFHDVYWDEEGEAMSRAVPDGALFFKRIRFEADARIDYKLKVDGEYKLDPLNPRVVESGMVERASELVMPGYRASTESMARVDVPQGELRVVDEAWAEPKVTIYLPPGYDSSKRYPAVYTADGSAWNDILRLPIILDNLIAEGVIEPVLAVMIDPTEDRHRWYQYNPDYLAYLEKVVEYVDRHYSTAARAETRLHVGTSSGGRAALYAALERAGLFRNLAMLSPSVIGPPDYLEPYFRGWKRPEEGLRIWLSAGTYEGYIYRDTRRLEKYFRKAGLRTQAVYTHEGHSFGAWRNLTPRMLEYFFPARPSEALISCQ